MDEEHVYFVSLAVIYPTRVIASSPEEAIAQALSECPYDPEDSVEPYVSLEE